MKIVFALSALAHRLSRPAIVFWTFPWLITLLVAGTIAQKYWGLYIAQKLFFSSFILWLGPIPLPGGYTVMGLIFVSLVCKFIAESKWSWQRAGIIITHLGVLVLLAGGILTALTSQEGYMTINEQDRSAIIQDYHARSLSIIKDGDVIGVIPFKELKEGRILGLEEGIPFNATIIETFINGQPQQRAPEETEQSGLTLQGPAQKIKMIPIKPDKQNENNHGGLTLSLRGTGTETDGLYLLTEIMPLYPQVEVKDHVYEFRFGKTQTALPFALALEDVTKESHPGMDMARAYRSSLVIHDQDTTWPAEISMNNPLRYRGYTFYQSSYIQRPDGETTVLSVVWNKGRLFPYIASLLVCVGLILHLVIQIKPRVLILVTALFLTIPFNPASANQPAASPDYDMEYFSMIPVLHEGRLKPMETFAAATLRKFSGSTHTGNMDSVSWLVEVLFDPANAAQRPVFVVRDTNLKHMLALPEASHHLYSFTQIAEALEPQAERLQKLAQIPTDKLDSQQKNLIILQKNIDEYMQIMRAFSLILPLAILPPDSLLNEQEKEALSKPYINYLDLQKFSARSQQELQKIIKRKGEDIATYSDKEKAVALFAWQMNMFAGSSEGNNFFRVIPVHQNQERLSPWAVLQEGQGTPATAALLEEWKNLGLAWLEGDSAAWQTQSRKLLQELVPDQEGSRLKTEKFYNLVNPFQTALVFYALALTFFIISLRISVPIWSKMALFSLNGGLIFHLGGMAARVMILQRPPVATLYESLLFVSFVSVLVGTLIELKRRDGSSGLLAAFAGLLILSVSLYFGSQSGDSLSMLVAVLNTNFWLATHVLIVTAGYGLCILTGLTAHAWLFIAKDRSGLFILMHRLALAGLLFTAVGTILGGIWADQSWGRFWGWDPKENGALLIVLWTIWLLHGRMAGQIKPVPYAVGLAMLNVVVALAWFGVNLLSVGLHSYGFISGVATGLLSFCLFEIILLAYLWKRKSSYA